MPEISIKEAREIYSINHEMKYLMLTKFPKEMLEADDSSTSDKSSHMNGMMIHSKDENGSECWQDFDNNKNLVHEKDSEE